MNHVDADATRKEIDSAMAAAFQRIVQWRHHLHQHPELSNRESGTASFITARLREIGFEDIRTGIAGNGIVAVLRGGLPGAGVVALRADMDALPIKEESNLPFASTVVDLSYPGGPFPVSHMCGHDCHVSAVLGSAIALTAVKDRLPGSVIFVFQPAEEGPPIGEVAGAKAMLDDGAYGNPTPTMTFGMHVNPLPKGTVGYVRGNQYAASCLVRITVKGQQAHASSPWFGADPYPAVASIISNSAQIYRQVPALSPVTISFGHVEDVGRFNIIGDTVTMYGTVRALDTDAMKEAQVKLAKLVKYQAQSFNVDAATEFLQEVPAVHNGGEWIDALLPTLHRVVGKDKVREIPGQMIYDDVSEFVNATGGAYLTYGVQDTYWDAEELKPTASGRGLYQNHGPHFYADDDALLDSARIHAHVALDHLLAKGDVRE